MKVPEVMRSICIIIFGFVPNLLYSMDLFVQRFPKMTFTQAQSAWAGLSSTDQRAIEVAENKRNKGKSNLIFDMIRFLPSDVYAEIMGRYCDYDEVSAKRYIESSFQDFSKVWAQEVYDGKRCKEFNQTMRDKIGKKISVEKILMFAEPIALIDRLLYEKNEKCLSLKNIKTLSCLISQEPLLIKIKDDLIGRCTYRYYRPYTLANFNLESDKYFYSYGLNNGRMIFVKSTLIVTGILLLSKFIEFNYCQKIEMPDVVYENLLQNELNQLIKRSDASERLSVFIKHLKDPMGFTWKDWFKKRLPCLLPFPACFYSLDERDHGMQLFINGMKLFIMSIYSILIFCGILMIPDFILKPVVMFVSGITVGMLLWPLVSMRSWKEKKIPWHKVDKLLNRNDIVIQ